MSVREYSTEGWNIYFNEYRNNKIRKVNSKRDRNNPLINQKKRKVYIMNTKR